MKKRDSVAKRKATEGDDGDKVDKLKTDEADAKSDGEKEPDKKKPKKTTTDSGNEIDDNKETESAEGGGGDATNETDEMLIDKSDNDDDDAGKKGDDKEKRKKFVRLWCMHCRIESATFKVGKSKKKNFTYCLINSYRYKCTVL